MRTHGRLLLVVGVLVFLAGCNRGGAPQPQAGPSTRPTQARAGSYTIDGPYVHENLAVFIIAGPDSLPGKTYLTLSEAMEQKKITVHETGSVNELSVENTSPDEEVYIQSGDVVKGGQQDRVLAYDMVVPPRSGKLAIASYCVEQGRWSQRGDEAAGYFAISTAAAPNSMKLAAKYAQDQTAVWREVAVQQSSLSGNAGRSVQSTTSPSSYQLSIEDDAVKSRAEEYSKALANLPQGRKGVVGYAVAINGKVVSADVYGSESLFRRLWPKMINSTAAEAFAAQQRNKSFAPPTSDEVKAAMLEAERGQASSKDIAPRVKVITHEAPTKLLFESRDSHRGGQWIHRNYISRHVASTQPSGARGQNLDIQQSANNVDIDNPQSQRRRPATRPATQPAQRIQESVPPRP